MINIEGIIGLTIVMIMFTFVFGTNNPDESIKRYTNYLRKDTKSRLKNRKTFLTHLKEILRKLVYGK